MTQEESNPLLLRKAVLVSRYATPFAILLISLAIVFSKPLPTVRNLTLGILAFGVLFNKVSIYCFRKAGKVAPWMIQLRLIVNLMTNVVAVYFIGTYWTPIWLLLALTPIATAIYGTKKQALLSSTGTALLLLGLQWTSGIHAPIAWSQQIIYGSFIISVSLMINELVSLTHLPDEDPL